MDGGGMEGEEDGSRGGTRRSKATKREAKGVRGTMRGRGGKGEEW